MPCPALPCPALPRPALPCPALPRPVQSLTVWLLSRTPDVSDQELQSFNDWLVANGIQSPGFNVFVRTPLDSSVCSNYWSSLN